MPITFQGTKTRPFSSSSCDLLAAQPTPRTYLFNRELCRATESYCKSVTGPSYLDNCFPWIEVRDGPPFLIWAEDLWVACWSTPASDGAPPASHDLVAKSFRDRRGDKPSEGSDFVSVYVQISWCEE